MSLKVLIVDDDAMIKMVHKVIVAKSNLCVGPIVLNDGKAAMDYFITDFNAQDHYLILLDINMPVMNGWDFLAAIQNYEFASRIYVIMVSSSIDIADKEKAHHYKQIIDYIEKPLRLAACEKIKSIPVLKRFFP